MLLLLSFMPQRLTQTQTGWVRYTDSDGLGVLHRLRLRLAGCVKQTYTQTHIGWMCYTDLDSDWLDVLNRLTFRLILAGCVTQT